MNLKLYNGEIVPRVFTGEKEGYLTTLVKNLKPTDGFSLEVRGLLFVLVDISNVINLNRSMAYCMNTGELTYIDPEREVFPVAYDLSAYGIPVESLAEIDPSNAH